MGHRFRPQLVWTGSRVSRTLAALLLFATAAAAVAQTGPSADPRPISDAERSAVQYAAEYLSKGPDSLWDHVATASPFHKLGRDEALRELEARLGPPSGATWELETSVPSLKDKVAVFSISYPSGADDTVAIEMVSEGGVYKISKVRALAEPAPNAVTELEAPPPESAEPKKEQQSSTLPLALGLIAAGLAAGGAFVFESNENASKGMIAGAAVLMLLSIGIAVRKDDHFRMTEQAAMVAEKKKEQPSFVRLSALLDLRRAMANGSQDVTPLLKHVPPMGEAHDVAQLWKAQSDLQQMKIDDVRAALKRFPAPCDIPMVEILRGRMAFFNADEIDAVLGYEHAVNLGPGRDGLWLEAAQALETLGFEERAKTYLRRLTRVGTRHASAYYSLSMLEAEKNQADEAEKYLVKGWRLKPMERQELLGLGSLWSVLRRPSISADINLGAAEEARFASPTVGSRALMLPIEAQTRVSGDFLSIQIGQQELLVPGGAALAPPNAPVVDAGTWGRLEEEKALADFQQLIAFAHSAGAFTQPAMRHRIEKTVDALASHNRWNDVLQLTDGLSPKSENVPASVFFTRGAALRHSGRDADAKQLFVQMAVSPVFQRKTSPQTIEQIGEMLASVEVYDGAVRMLEKANSIRQNPYTDDRIRQLEMNRRLATSYSVMKSDHFEVHYPDDVGVNQVNLTLRVLEDEFKRLQRWVPLSSYQTVVVNLLQWQEFRSTYTGSDFILGFYDGKLTVPLGGARFVPPVVGILSHELCHALLAQATNDQAPHWFQEGMAQRIEMVDFQPNAFNMYSADKLIPVSLIDAVISGSVDPEMIQEGYIVSQTIIRFIEASWGIGGLQRMIASYRAGANTEEAIRQLTGLSIPEFDARLRTWGQKANVFDNPPPVRYDDFDEIQIGRPTRSGAVREQAAAPAAERTAR
jgi:tetratricopeptide (TPR) repeat protein